MRRITRWLLVAALALAAGAAGLAWRLHRRALPTLDGVRPAAGLSSRVEIVRDRWGVPHLFADEDDAAYFGLGWVHAQDRLFQLELHRHAAQGRLAELFGPQAVDVDRLFRTMAFHATARRMLEAARPEARAAARAYAAGVNAALRDLGGRLPIELALLGHEVEPVEADDFVGILGYMAWGLNDAWTFDPLYTELERRVGPEAAAGLFPLRRGGRPSVHPPAAAPGPADPRTAGRALPAARFALSFTPWQRGLLAQLPALRASNDWVLGPGKSRSGRPILANDPHLAHGLPGIWYEAHLSTPTQDVIGVTLVGFPLVVIGHNRDVAWGFTNVMQDASDFFVERLDPERPDRVLYRGEWVPLEVRREVVKVKGADPVSVEVRSTPHGPLVSDLVRTRKDAALPDLEGDVAFQWTYHAAREANEVEGLWLLNRARDWQSFRAALGHFGAVAQNVAYADAAGHIGIQTTGAFPILAGKTDGLGFRVGWDGSEEWEGFHPFEENPVTLDPAEGWLASANNPTVEAPGPFYISWLWEPIDRIARIREVLAGTPQLSTEDVARLQRDVRLVSARERTPMVLAAFEAHPPQEPALRAALDELRGWDGEMRVDRAAPALYAAFERRLFDAIFADELGAPLADAFQARANVDASMVRAVLASPDLARWLDRVDTDEVEDRDAVLRSAFARGVAELAERLGGEPAGWTWERLHTLTFTHPLGAASRLLGAYLDRGPYPVPGASATVNKMEYGPEDFRVVFGPSMRQITDFADLDGALAVIPGGQSGIPASPHYDDLIPLWLAGEYHPFPLGRSAVDGIAAHRLVLEPQR